jgi:hypothetical protein
MSTNGEDDEFLPIAEEGLRAPMPDGWKSCRSAEGETFYFNTLTGESTWDHPVDTLYRQKFQQAKQLKLTPVPTDTETIDTLRSEIKALKNACSEKDAEIRNLNDTLAGLIETLRASQAEVLQLSGKTSADESAMVWKELSDIKNFLQVNLGKQVRE